MPGSFLISNRIYERDFDQGSYIDVSGTSTIRITPYKHWSSIWAWWAFWSMQMGGTTPTFLIAKADHYNMEAGERLCCWAQAADTDTWYDFDNVTIGETDLEFSMDTPFPAGLIYVSALPMYPFSRVQRKMNLWLQHAYVSDTTSSTDGIIDYATERSVPDGSGRTVAALPFYGFKITGDRVGDKNIAILSSCNHPSETPGPYQLEGALDWLMGGSASAETLLDYFEFYVYPCTNPQGVWSGWFRSSPQTAATDNNRLWSTTGTNEAVDAFKTAMNADTGGAVDIGFDYHSVMSSTDIYGSVQPGDTGALYGYFNTEMQALDADFNLGESNIADSLRYWWKDTLGGDLTISMEQGGELARGVAEFKAYGGHSMQALYEMLVDGRFTYGP